MLSIAQIRQTLLDKERSATEIAQEFLDRIDRLEPKSHSFVTVTPEVVFVVTYGLNSWSSSVKTKPKNKKISVLRS